MVPFSTLEGCFAVLSNHLILPPCFISLPLFLAHSSTHQRWQGKEVRKICMGRETRKQLLGRWIVLTQKTRLLQTWQICKSIICVARSAKNTSTKDALVFPCSRTRLPPSSLLIAPVGSNSWFGISFKMADLDQFLGSVWERGRMKWGFEMSPRYLQPWPVQQTQQLSQQIARTAVANPNAILTMMCCPHSMNRLQEPQRWLRCLLEVGWLCWLNTLIHACSHTEIMCLFRAMHAHLLNLCAYTIFILNWQI